MEATEKERRKERGGKIQLRGRRPVYLFFIFYFSVSPVLRRWSQAGGVDGGGGRSLHAKSCARTGFPGFAQCICALVASLFTASSSLKAEAKSLGYSTAVAWRWSSAPIVLSIDALLAPPEGGGGNLCPIFKTPCCCSANKFCFYPVAHTEAGLA